MNQIELNKILKEHEAWVNNNENGKRLDLRFENLQGADLQGAVLWCADLQGANLQGANLQGANLWCADLQDADLQGANLIGAMIAYTK